MALFNDQIKSFVTGLSDFWLLYFKEIDQLKVFYKGSEILIGQTYLNLMSLLLNNSVQDTTVFNKEFFKLLLIKETDIRFRAGTTAATDRYIVEFPDDIVFARHLNNKILEATAGLDKDVDYYINDDTRSLEFVFDPASAYRELTFGVDNSQFRVRSNIITGSNIRVHLDDTGGLLTITRTNYDIVIAYDGPASGATTTATDIVQALNLDPSTQSLLFTEVTGLGTGTDSPVGNASLTPLAKVSLNSVDGFATRQLEAPFASKLTDTTITDWVAAGVEKGDTLRLLAGVATGAPVELPIHLVRADAIYQDVDVAPSLLSSDKIDFVVLREPENATSSLEPIANSGVTVQSGLDGTVDSSTRLFSSPTAVFSTVHAGDIIEITSALNVGAYRILSVVDSFTVELAAAGITTETPVNWGLYSVVTPTNIGTDGVLTNNLDNTATFTAATAVFISQYVGTVLKLERGGIVEIYNIIGFVSATELILEVEDTIADGAALSWGVASTFTAAQAVVFSPPSGWIKPDTMSVNARRLVDNQIVLEGRDYNVVLDTGRISPTTVWRTSVSNTATYDYRLAVVENTTPLQSGVDGTITLGTPNVFTAPTAVFTQYHEGYALRIGNSGLTGASNNGEHFVAVVTSPTTAELTDDKLVATTVDPSNGALSWELMRRGSLETTDVTALVEQSSYWIPDALIDKFHLYNTYGYLINRFERSSEEYRSLIRGIFQLFMLGPTLERFESAINTVAGLDVIRDTGEILLGYDNEASQAGTDGYFDYTTRTFTSVTAVFTAASVGGFIFAVDGANVGRLFKVASVTSATVVILEDAPVTNGPISWELTTTATQTVSTSRTDYVYSRNLPIRSAVQDPANAGVTIFRAFEVLTDVFTVTDYVEDPNWFDFVKIPEELLPTESASRRQSTPALFENVVGPADEAHVGDPGFVIGADSEGFIPPSVFLRDDVGAFDGVVVGDISYPFSNTVTFTSATGAFTAADVGNKLIVDPGGPAEESYGILQVSSPTEIVLNAFEDVEDATGLSWAVWSSPLAKRHKTAFVILNQFLKTHLFSVDFDIALLSEVSSTLLGDLQQLVFVAKPSYTYIVVSPSAFFQEIIQVNEEFEYDTTFSLGGAEGVIIAANENPLLVIGSSWRIGNWFRYLDNTSTFAAPDVTVPTPLGATTAGYRNYVNKIYVEPTDFTSAGDPIQVSERVFGANPSDSGVSNLTLTVVGDVVTATLPVAAFQDNHLLATLRVFRSTLGNNGDYRIGAVPDAFNAVISAPSVVSESGLRWEIVHIGGIQGEITVADGGLVTFNDQSSLHEFEGAHVGDYLRRPIITYLSNQVFLVDEVVSDYQVRLATQNQVDPIADDPDATCSVVSQVLTVAFGDVVFTKAMAVHDRALLDATTKDVSQYFINFTSGPDTGLQFPIWKYIAANQIEVLGTTDTASADFHITVKQAPSAVNEIADWEHVREQIVINGTTVDLTNTPTQDVNGAVAFTAYGVREPIDPSIETMDETAGDTLYSVGMQDPRQKRGKSRTGNETDLRDEPIEIKRT